MKLSATGLEVRYGQVVALRGVDIDVVEHELTVVIGPNGAGKTTFLRTVAGLETHAEGSLVLDGEHVEHATPEKMLARGVALVPEGRHVFPHLSVRDNLVLGAFRFRRSRPKVDEAMQDVFEWFPTLERFTDRIAGTLSGGEQQMLAIGRALMSRPTLLCLDEPSLGLAPIVVQNLLALLRRLCDDGVTVLLVEQFAYLALQAADHAYLLENGTVVRSGSARQLLADKHVKTSYLGVQTKPKRASRAKATA